MASAPTIVPEWRNWYTHQTQNLARFTPHESSSLSSGTTQSGLRNHVKFAVEGIAKVVRYLFRHGVIVTEKPQAIRVATHFFNNEDDIEKLIGSLKGCADS